jgi:hypothetical protein
MRVSERSSAKKLPRPRTESRNIVYASTILDSSREGVYNLQLRVIFKSKIFLYEEFCLLEHNAV